MGALISNITVISARSLYEQHGILAPCVWKCRAINDLVFDFSAGHLEQQLSVISVGDGSSEQNATSWAVQDVPTCYGKTVKFEKSPHIRKLIDEQSLITEHLQYIVSHPDD